MTFDFYIRGDNESKGIIQKNCMIFISTIHDKYQKNFAQRPFWGFLSSEIHRILFYPFFVSKGRRIYVERYIPGNT